MSDHSPTVTNPARSPKTKPRARQRLRTGAPWRHTPDRYDKWNSAHVHFSYWNKFGVRDAAFDLRPIMWVGNARHTSITADASILPGHSAQLPPISQRVAYLKSQTIGQTISNALAGKGDASGANVRRLRGARCVGEAAAPAWQSTCGLRASRGRRLRRARQGMASRTNSGWAPGPSDTCSEAFLRVRRRSRDERLLARAKRSYDLAE